MAYIDTSLLVAYYCPEPLSRQVQQVLADVEQPVISPLVELELYSAVAAKVRTRHLDLPTARRILALFQKHLADGCYGMVTVEMAEYRLARDWIGGLSSSVRVADALHLAAAAINNLTLLTADKTLAKWAGQFAVRCQLVD
jgi:uncharacterized protein